MARSLGRPSSESVTITLEETSPPAATAAAETLVLRLKRRANKKVTWKEGTVDNEFLNRKSSKSCCIFHKEKPFDEDDSDDDDDNVGGHDHCHGGGSDGGAGPSGCCSRPSD